MGWAYPRVRRSAKFKLGLLEAAKVFVVCLLHSGKLFSFSFVFLPLLTISVKSLFPWVSWRNCLIHFHVDSMVTLFLWRIGGYTCLHISSAYLFLPFLTSSLYMSKFIRT